MSHVNAIFSNLKVSLLNILAVVFTYVVQMDSKEEKRGLSQIPVKCFSFLFFFFEQHNQKDSFIHIQLSAPSSRSLLPLDRKFCSRMCSERKMQKT